MYYDNCFVSFSNIKDKFFIYFLNTNAKKQVVQSNWTTFKNTLTISKWSLTAIKRLHHTDSYHFSFPSAVCQLATPAVSQASNDSENSRPESWHTRTERHCWYSLCVIHPLCSPWSSHQTAVWEWPRTRDEKTKKRERKHELGRVHSQISIEMIRYDAMMWSEIMWW